MTINGTNGVSAGVPAGQSGMPQGSDPVSKDIQNQISRLQKQLQELSANTEMGSEAKMKKRQELQKQISDLNVQLRQHQIEMRKKEQEEKASFDDMLGTEPQGAKAKGKGQEAAISQASMEAMISAGTAMEQAKVHGAVAAKMEGRAGVLKAEISLDAGRGGNTDLKDAELADAEQKAMDATSSQMGMLSKANQAMEEASKDSETNDEKTEETEEKKSGEAAEAGSVTDSDSGMQDGDALEGAAPVVAPVRQYVPVDVRL